MSVEREDEGATNGAAGLDAVERLLRDARYAAPAGLAARLAARARDPEAGRIVFWADVERTARSLIMKVAAAAVVAVGLALAVTSLPDNATTRSAALGDEGVTLDQMARFAVSPSSIDATLGSPSSVLADADRSASSADEER